MSEDLDRGLMVITWGPIEEQHLGSCNKVILGSLLQRYPSLPSVGRESEDHAKLQTIVNDVVEQYMVVNVVCSISTYLVRNKEVKHFWQFPEAYEGPSDPQLQQHWHVLRGLDHFEEHVLNL